jgi:peptide/nickel transport system substrate-binding protein
MPKPTRTPKRTRTPAPVLALAAALTLALVAAACGGDDDGGGAADGDATEEAAAAADRSAAGANPPDGETCTEDRVGGELTMGTYTPTTSLDPAVALGSGSAGAIQMTALYDTLLRYDPESGEFEPHVAESFEASDDLTEWTVTLREGVTFGNGDPLTTEAVRFSFERMQQAPVGSAQQANQIAEMEIVDDLTMVFHLNQPTGDFAYVLAEDAANIVNPAVVEEMGAEAFGTDPVGAGVGPYEIERFAPDEEVVMTARDDYWGGPVCIETLRFVYVAGGQATYDAFRNDELDMAFITDTPTVARAKDEGVTGYGNVAGAATFLVINNGISETTAPTDDVRVRQAIAQAIDLDVLNDRVEDGAGIATSLLVDPESAIAPEGAEEIPHDPAAAEELVTEVMDETGWDGSIRLLGAQTPEGEDTTITLEAMLEAVGFDVTVENVPNEVVQERIVFTPDFDLATFGMSIFEESPMARLNQWETDSPRSRTGYADPEMDAALEQMRLAGDREAKREAMAEVQRVWNETVPSAVLFAREEFVATAPEVHGLVYSRDTVPMFHDAYIEE